MAQHPCDRVKEVGGVVKTTSRGARVVVMVGYEASGGMTNGVVTGKVIGVSGDVSSSVVGGVVMQLFDGSLRGDDSFEEMSVTLVWVIFLGGFLVEEESLEALVILKVG
ncbi:hypothetical protein Tco_0631954 [Tanacetum coccineum]